jgi:hypothetical protein
MDPLGQDEVRASFVNCTRGEAKGVTLPARPSEIPWERREFLGWRDPKAPSRAYLVLPFGGEVVGLALRAAPAPKSRLRSNICGFCTTTHGLADITLFSGRRAGRPAARLKSDVPQPYETLTLDERLARLEEKLHKFVARVLESR